MVQRRPARGKPAHGNVQWIARYKDVTGRGRSKTFATRSEALAYEVEQRHAVAHRTWIDPAHQRVTVAEIFARWADRPVRASTADGYRQTGRNLGDLADMPIAALTGADVDAWYRQLTTGRPWHGGADRGVSETTAREHVRRLASAVRAAVDTGVIARNPVKIPRRATAGVLRSEIPTDDDVAHMARLARDGGYRYHRHAGRGVRPTLATGRANPCLSDMILTAAATGLRVSELAGLTVGDVDFMRRVVRVELQAAHRGRERVATKTARSVRAVPVADDLLQLLGPRCSGRQPGDRLFVNASGRPWSGQTVGVSLGRVADAAGVSWTFHSFRHLYASRLIAAGVSVRAVQDALGHADAATTLRVYTHLWSDAEDTTRAAVEGVVEAAQTARGIAGGSGSGRGAVTTRLAGRDRFG